MKRCIATMDADANLEIGIELRRKKVLKQTRFVYKVVLQKGLHHIWRCCDRPRTAAGCISGRHTGNNNIARRMVPGVICNYRRWVAKKCKFQSYMIAKTLENKIFLSSSHYPFTFTQSIAFLSGCPRG